MLLVDSTVWISYFNGQQTAETDYLDHRLTSRLILVGDLILAEVLQGFRTDAEFELARARLGRFVQRSMLNPSLAVVSAINYRYLRQRGITIRKTIDCIIATYAIENGHELLHADRDFDPFEVFLGLRVVHP
ncbi:MAG: PIN domain nuclease [Caldilineales bacterium]|nr:PIN domain nuclease [Caldilineales bacterium]